VTRDPPKGWVPRPRDPEAAPPGALRQIGSWLAAWRDPEAYDRLSDTARFWVTRAALLLAILAVMLFFAFVIWMIGPAPNL
jgi:hypothetical protein